MMIKFYPDKQDKWRARITAANGEIIFSSHQGFSSKQQCKHNLKIVSEAIYDQFHLGGERQ